MIFQKKSVTQTVTYRPFRPATIPAKIQKFNGFFPKMAINSKKKRKETQTNKGE
jgi:hypothetical protein